MNKSSEFFYKHPILSFDEKGLPYSYTDLYGKLSFHGGNGSKLNIFGAEGGIRGNKIMNSIAGVALVGGLIYFLFVSDESPLDVLVEDMNAEAEEHWWHR